MDTASPISSSSPTHAPASGTAPTKSPSGLSYTSSGASPPLSSTHHPSCPTSPNPITATPSSSPSHQQSTLVDISSHIDLQCIPTSSSLPNQTHKMERNPFQSVNERRNKLAMDQNTATGNQIQQQTQQSPSQAHFPSQTLRSNMQQLAISPRGPASSNWRSQGATDDQAYASSSRGSSGEYAPFDNMTAPLSHPSTILRQQSQQTSSYISPRAEHFPQHQLDFMSASTNHNAGPAAVSGMGAGTGPGMNTGMSTGEGATAATAGSFFPQVHPDGIYAYCFDRGNGQYTRLIPADMLPPLKDVPALQPGCAGMMVLPLPRGLPQNGRSSNTEMVILKTPNTPTSPSDTIQNRIDTIVASTPPTPPHHQSSHSISSGGINGTTGPNASGPGGQGPHHNHGAPYPTTGAVQQPFDTPNPNGSHGGRATSGGQGTHGGSGHHGHGAGGQQPQRRPKVYCDKWVHEGVCAFTQQGCKYKHEMPFDKVTQHALGLFHGFPAWWKKHQADLSRQREGPGPAVSALGLGLGLGIVGEGEGKGGRFGARAGALQGAAGGAGPSSAGVGFVEGKADPAGLAASPTTPGLPSWRRGGENASVEQKSLGTGRGMARNVGSGVRNPLVSYGSPFGPIAPPARTFGAGPSAAGNPYTSLESLGDSNTGVDNGEEEVAGETTRSSGARLN
ncbi:uncharacterized protein GGS22DRAFT_191890 [Annulohypoxylon maeteangense]|uniref:uncharacterized protein n=1 Tax=Annulohypoxylon maeteangense TaxID=1927788 RepID=UPI0020077A52|nr:uncharacterized protein GGS22DRAFT_191890 [Annulohypoxylon maeteangense]KAI0881703.1 hypothetical protein GGS22DRAFT_191890 [Annulohypoxylon maeteangense]